MRAILDRILTDPMVGLSILLWTIGVCADIVLKLASERAVDAWAVLEIFGHAMIGLGVLLSALFARPPNTTFVEPGSLVLPPMRASEPLPAADGGDR